MSSETPTGSLPTGGDGDAVAAGAAGSGPVAPIDPAAPAPVDPTVPATPAPVDPAAPAPSASPAEVAALVTTSSDDQSVDEPDEAPEPTDPAEILAQELLELPGVADLHGGLFGEVATYLPGRRVTGIRFADERTDVHIVVEWGSSVHDVVEAVRTTTERHTATSVDVYVEDVAAPGRA